MVGRTRRQALGALGAVLVAGGMTACAGRSVPRSTAPVSAIPRPTVARVTPAIASVRGGTVVSVVGSGLSRITAVRIGSTTVPVSSAAADRVVFTAPGSTDFASGRVEATLVADGSAAATAPLQYDTVDGIDRQLQYLLRYWKHYNPAYPAIPGDDCVDFTSQSLLERGWKQQGAWTHAADVDESGPAWRSSTAFEQFMEAHAELGTALTDAERSKVRVGDVVQFDWDRSGDRDHTGVVTRVSTEGGRAKVFFAGHTDDSDYRDVDVAITKDHPGGIAYYWSLT